MPGPTRKTIRSLVSIDLNKLGPNDYYDATLSGNFLSAMAAWELTGFLALFLGELWMREPRRAQLSLLYR